MGKNVKGWTCYIASLIQWYQHAFFDFENHLEAHIGSKPASTENKTFKNRSTKSESKITFILQPNMEKLFTDFQNS